MQCDQAFLYSMRCIGDEDGDRLVDIVLAGLDEDSELAPKHRLMAHLIEHDELPPSSFPPELKRFLHASERFPQFDMEKIRRGQAVFAEHGPEMMLSLGTYSLPGAYASNDGAKVLVQTDYLVSFPQRRLLETAQMVIDVMRPGGLDRDGRGFATARKVRLMHAAIRHLILEREDPAWDVERLGIPINQEDLAGTLTTFAYMPLDALEKLGVRLEIEDKDAYVYAWRCVGEIMGIHEALLPNDFAEVESLAYAISAGQIRTEEPNEAGRELTRALIDMMEGMLPGRIFDPSVPAMMRFFLPTEVANALSIERSLLGSIYVEVGAFLARCFTRWRLATPLRRFLFRHLSLAMIQAFIDHDRGGKRAEFDLPLSLRGAWQRH